MVCRRGHAVATYRRGMLLLTLRAVRPCYGAMVRPALWCYGAEPRRRRRRPRAPHCTVPRTKTRHEQAALGTFKGADTDLDRCTAATHAPRALDGFYPLPGPALEAAGTVCNGSAAGPEQGRWRCVE
jgi:hypothetical protein